MSTKEKIYVAMSGGVDSSLSAALLQKEGYDVTGVFIRVWQPEWLPCDWKEEREDAMRVCAKLDIPFQTLNLSEEYKREVVEYMLYEYQEGRTPNPDVMCNKYIKFGAFYKWAKEQGAGRIATGHYAQRREEQDTYYLLKGRDTKKDQSYFLWTLSQDVLAHTFFPIGDMEKQEVRAQAMRYDLPVADKKDSQGICFLGKVNMREFLQHYIETEKGEVLNTSGDVIGTHAGALLYTFGQRHGYHIDTQTANSTPHYVVAKDIKDNTITVSDKYEEEVAHMTKSMLLKNTNWIGEAPKKEKFYTARFRYRQSLRECTVLIQKNNTADVTFSEPQKGIAEGQSLVLYDENICLGGGILFRSAL